MAYHDDLLWQADHLAHLDRTRPKQANLRRAISSAYYALFHLLIASAVGNWRIERQRSGLSRMFDHGKMRGACAKMRSANPDLRIVAEAFVDLQKYRHLADYDSSKIWTRVDVDGHIADAQKAFEAWSRVKALPEAQDFLFSLFVPDRR